MMLRSFAMNCFFIALGTIVFACPAAQAEFVVHLPYANASNGTLDCGCTPWGPSGSAMYDKLYGTAGSNVVWNESRVYYNTEQTESWYESIEGDKTFQVYIHNDNATAFTGTQKLKLYVYEKSGALATEATLFDRTKSSATANLLINQNATPDLTWNSNGNYFEVSVGAGESLTLNAWGATNGILNAPNDNTHKQLHFRLVQPNDLPFDASLRGQGEKRYRITTGYGSSWRFGPKINMFSFGYQGVTGENFLSSQDDKLVLPYWREQCFTSTADSAKMCWNTIVYLINGASAQDTITIRVEKQDGSYLDGVDDAEYDVTLDENEKFVFSPSQFMQADTSAQNKGRIIITGTNPIALALQIRFSSTGSVISSTPVRIDGSTMMPFLINP